MERESPVESRMDFPRSFEWAARTYENEGALEEGAARGAPRRQKRRDGAVQVAQQPWRSRSRCGHDAK